MTTRKIKDAKDLSINELIYFKGHAQATYLSDGRTVEEAIPTKFSDLENDQSLVNQFQLATINGQSLVNDGQDITIESSNIDTSSFATKETVMTDEIAVNADGFRTTNGEWFALPGTDSENNSDYCIATFDDIPTSTSDLTNDSGFITSADNIDSATKLQTTRYINGVGFDGTSNITNYATCRTFAREKVKFVTPITENFYLNEGSKITVKFTYGNSESSPELNVNDTGSKPIQYRGDYLQSNQYWEDGDVVDFVYDGSAWQVIGLINDNVGSDTKVTQTITTTNSTYPLLFSATANKSTSSADAARFSSNLKYNPSTDTLTVGNISSNIPGVTDGGANFLGTCSSTAASSEKIINLFGVNLMTGSRVWIYFSYGNSCLGNVDCTINHKGTQITKAKISINGVYGSYVEAIGDQNNSNYQSGIVFSSGYYEFIVEIIDDVCYLRMTNNYIADRSPELHIESDSTISYNIFLILTPGIHTVFDNPGIRILTASTFPNRSYSFEFTSGTTVPTLTLPVDVKWANGTIPTWEANTTYHISIVNNCAVCASFKKVS